MQGCKCDRGYAGATCSDMTQWPSKHVTVCYDSDCESRAGYFFKVGMKKSVANEMNDENSN